MMDKTKADLSSFLRTAKKHRIQHTLPLYVVRESDLLAYNARVEEARLLVHNWSRSAIREIDKIFPRKR